MTKFRMYKIKQKKALKLKIKLKTVLSCCVLRTKPEAY